MATAPLTAQDSERGIILHDVSWDEYISLLEWIGDRRVHVTYDRGTLELMSPSYEHDREKSILARFIEALTLELDLDLQSAGSTTLKNPLVRRGLEPDECYWTRNEPLIRGKRKLDLGVDPPPDLVIEVDVTRSVLDRLEIYAALGVPEVWRFHGEAIEVLLLQPGGHYETSQVSLSFPTLPMRQLSAFVMRCYTMRETDLVRSFVEWVRAGMPTEV